MVASLAAKCIRHRWVAQQRLVMAMTVLAIAPGIATIYFVRNHPAKGFVIRT
jgi:ABC-type glycerol-3-phosphate transport system permease component